MKDLLLCPCPIAAAVWFARRDICESRRPRQRTTAHPRHCDSSPGNRKCALAPRSRQRTVRTPPTMLLGCSIINTQSNAGAGSVKSDVL